MASQVFNTVKNIYPQLPSTLIDWRGFDINMGGFDFNIGRLSIGMESRQYHIKGPAITLRRATEKITAYEHQQYPRVYVGHSRGADSILEGIRTGKIILDRNTKLVLIGANKNLIKGALENLGKVGAVLIIAGENDYFGGVRSYGEILKLKDIPSNVKVLPTQVRHERMGRSKEVSSLINRNADWLKK